MELAVAIVENQYYIIFGLSAGWIIGHWVYVREKPKRKKKKEGIKKDGV